MVRPSTKRHLRRILAGVALSAVLLGGMPAPAGADHNFHHLEPIGIESFCQGVPEGSTPLTDVAGTTFRAEVECLFVPSITLGSTSGTIYRPEGIVPRDQMASFIARTIGVAEGLEVPGRDLRGLDDATCDIAPFVDVDPSAVHRCSINMLAAENIVFGGVGGRSDNLYSPNIPVTRGQMATFVKRAVEHLLQEEVGTEFDYFFDDDGDTHEPAIDFVGENGIAVGNGAGVFDPDQPVTRGQMAAFLARTLAVLVERGDIAPLTSAG